MNLIQNMSLIGFRSELGYRVGPASGRLGVRIPAETDLSRFFGVFFLNLNFIYSLNPINWYMRYNNNIIIYICTNWSEVHIGGNIFNRLCTKFNLFCLKPPVKNSDFTTAWICEMYIFSNLQRGNTSGKNNYLHEKLE